MISTSLKKTLSSAAAFIKEDKTDSVSLTASKSRGQPDMISPLSTLKNNEGKKCGKSAACLGQNVQNQKLSPSLRLEVLFS